jgi:multiple sugar transport system permease protein
MTITTQPVLRRRTRNSDVSTRTLMSSRQLTHGKGRVLYLITLWGTMMAFSVAFIFPLYWLATAALKSPSELATTPPTLVPTEWHWENLSAAFGNMRIIHFLLNTFMYAAGALVFQVVFDVAAAYALSKLRPRFGNVILGLILATLMVPAAAMLVPNYLAVVDVPIFHINLLNTPWAIWLPAIANGFNVYVLKRFFDQIPNELLDSAAIDGAGRLRVLWSVILPISRPVLAVISIFAFINVWKDFLWPLLVMSEPERNPLQVMLYRVGSVIGRDELMAGLAISSVPMIVIFLAFQRSILDGLAAGSMKG